ncbi:efflux transporter outer membrane subunit [Alteraurantiacibacter buctensis]|uniref:efflux transporter outer membrane subunit n=1 Tax=Alteraurantiacibacter buctensis TaxID=1503981 RepID=UPI00301C1B3E
MKSVSGQAARNLTLALIALTAAGCAGPQVAAPQASLPVPAAWVESDPAPISVDIAEYWRLLNDPLLTELVERSIAENRDLAQSAARLDLARSQLRQARAGYLPSVTASAGSGRDLGTNNPGRNSVSIGADAQWEADLFGRVSSNVAASQADLVAAGYSLADLQRAIVGQVAISTVQARALALQLQIARDTLAFQEDNLQIARWRNQAGLVDSLDVEQARTQRAQTAATIPQLESSLAATANALSTLAGEPPGRVLAALAGSDAFVPSPAPLAGWEAPAEVLRRRPDVRGAEASLVAAAARVGVARTQLLPALRLTGSVGTGALGIGSLFDILTANVFAGVTQLLFDGGRTRAQIEGAEASARGAQAAWEQAILQALEEVESAAVDQRTSAERVDLSAEAVDAASNSVLLARSQYQAGLIDFRTLLSAENQLLSARNQLVGAQADRASAFVRLTQALGGGWSGTDYAADPSLLPAQDESER